MKRCAFLSVSVEVCNLVGQMSIFVEGDSGVCFVENWWFKQALSYTGSCVSGASESGMALPVLPIPCALRSGATPCV